jgi:hypothetical protein
MVRRRNGQGWLGEVVLFGALGAPAELLDPALRRVDPLLSDDALVDTVEVAPVPWRGDRFRGYAAGRSFRS